jgi:methylated-DNA-[protein]-cysteine S-methyltransferase
MNTIVWTSVATSWGPCGLIWRTDTSRLTRIFAAYPESATMEYTVPKYFPTAQRHNPNTRIAGDPSWLPVVIPFLQRYYELDGPVVAQPPSAVLAQMLDWSQCTEFQHMVLTQTAQIPFGRTTSYGLLAQRIGRTGASRAVGGALAKNPWPVLIPCHRVIGANGAMTGFSAPGSRIAKARMIQMEQERLPIQMGTNAMEPSSAVDILPQLALR